MKYWLQIPILLFLLSMTACLKPSQQAEDFKMPKQDRIDLAFKQEIEMTRDPSTNEVPRERLIQAMEIMERKAANPSRQAVPDIAWEERGPYNVGGRTRAIIFDANDPTNNTIFAGGASGGLWKGTNMLSSQPTWTPVNDFWNTLAIGSIIQDPSNANIIYVGTGESFTSSFSSVRGLGIWKSVDGGQSFQPLLSTLDSRFHYVPDMLIDNNGNLYAITRDGGLQRSTNAGVTWTQVLDIPNGNDLEMAANGDLYVTFNGRVLKSPHTHGSQTGNLGKWIDKTPTTAPFARLELAIAPSDASRLFLSAQGRYSGGLTNVLRSDNGGDSWVNIPLPDPNQQRFLTGQEWYNLISAVYPNDPDRLILGMIEHMIYDNKTQTWELFSSGGNFPGISNVHVDQHAIVFAPGSSDLIMFGNDGGVYYTTNGSTYPPSIVHRNYGYITTQFYTCALSPVAWSNDFMGGTQDNGTPRLSQPGVGNSYDLTGGDGAFCHFDQDEPNIQIASSQGSVYSITNDNFATRANRNGGFKGRFINPTDYDSENNIQYGAHEAGKYEMILDVGGTNTLTNRSVSAFSNQQVSAVTVSPNDPTTVYFGLKESYFSNVSSIVKVKNAHSSNPSGDVIFNGSGYIASIAVEEGDDNHILFTYSNYGVESIHETKDGGTSWTSIGNGLPDMPIRWITFSPETNEHVFIGTELGVWSTIALNGAQTDWTPTNDGLANCRVDMIQTRKSDNTILVGTYGRGMYTATLGVEADFEIGDFVNGNRIQFSNQSMNADKYLWDFGDGIKSTDANPSHIFPFNGEGIYQVKLIATNEALNRSDTIIKPVLTYRIVNNGQEEMDHIMQVRTQALDVDGDRIILGMRNGREAYLLERTSFDYWEIKEVFERSELNPNLGANKFGGAVGLVGDYALVSYRVEYSDDFPCFEPDPFFQCFSQGFYYRTRVYKKVGGEWVYTKTLNGGETIDTEGEKAVISVNDHDFTYEDPFGGVERIESGPVLYEVSGNDLVEKASMIKFIDEGTIDPFPLPITHTSFADLSSDGQRILAYMPVKDNSSIANEEGWVVYKVMANGTLVEETTFFQPASYISGAIDGNGLTFSTEENNNRSIYQFKNGAWTPTSSIPYVGVSMRGNRLLGGVYEGTPQRRGRIDVYKNISGNFSKLDEWKGINITLELAQVITEDDDRVVAQADNAVLIYENAEVDNLPTTLVAEYNTLLLVNLFWQAIPGASGYKIERKIDNGSFVPLTDPMGSPLQLGSATTSYVDTLLEFGKPVYYRVIGKVGNQYLAPSNVVSVSQPRIIRRLDLTYSCYNANSQELRWNVHNPNSINIPFIYAQWWSPQRDTLIAPPGNSQFTTVNIPQNGATYGDDNITGVWWVDHRLLPGEPNDVVRRGIDLGISCGQNRLPENPAEKAPDGMFKGQLKKYMQVPDLLGEGNNITKVYPNPFGDKVTVAVSLPDVACDVRLYNQAGQLVLKQSFEAFQKEHVLSTTQLPSGLYMLEVQMGDVKEVHKLIK